MRVLSGSLSVACLGLGTLACLPLESRAEGAAAPGTPEPATPDLEAEQTEASPSTETADPLQAELEEPLWASTLEIYAFAPLRTTGTTTINDFDSETRANLSEVLDALDWLSYVRGSVERGRWGLMGDVTYVRLGSRASAVSADNQLTGDAQIGLDQGVYDLALRYRFGDREAAIAKPGTYSIIPYAGIRVIDVSLDLDVEVNQVGVSDPVFERRADYGRTWVQPLTGIQGSYFLSDRLRAFARADIGGFNISGPEDLSGNVQFGLGYAIGNNTQLNLSWRYQAIRYDNGNSPKSAYSDYQNGVELGFKFFF